MKYTYDPIADAVNIVLKKGRVATTREVAPGVLIDLDKKGAPLYLEILDASRRFVRRGVRKEKNASRAASSGQHKRIPASIH